MLTFTLVYFNATIYSWNIPLCPMHAWLYIVHLDDNKVINVLIMLFTLPRNPYSFACNSPMKFVCLFDLAYLFQRKERRHSIFWQMPNFFNLLKQQAARSAALPSEYSLFTTGTWKSKMIHKRGVQINKLSLSYELGVRLKPIWAQKFNSTAKIITYP